MKMLGKITQEMKNNKLSNKFMFLISFFLRNTKLEYKNSYKHKRKQEYYQMGPYIYVCICLFIRTNIRLKL